MESKPIASYSPAADVLRVLAILAVVLIHTSGRSLESVSYDLARVPWTLFLNQVTRFAVPLFFLISGFVLELSHKNDLNYFRFIWKRLNRIAIPYVFWSIIYYLFVYSQNHEPFPRVLIDGSASYQLYFIPTLIIFYLIFPLLHRLRGLLTNKWVLAILGILQLWILYQWYYVQPLPFFYPVSIALVNYYAFVSGIAVAQNQEKILEFLKKWSFLPAILTAGFLYVVYTEALNIYLRTQNYLAFTTQWRPSVLLYMLALAGVLYPFLNSDRFQQIPRILPTIKILSKLSFFVFFVHVIFLELVWSRLLLPFIRQTQTHVVEQFWFDPVFFLAVTLLSFGLAFLIHKIPLANKITG